MSEKLKPCPFCGGETRYEIKEDKSIDKKYGTHYHVASCPIEYIADGKLIGCGISKSAWSFEKLQNKWNNRPRETELVETIRELREALDHLYDAQTTEETCGYYLHGMKKAKQALENTKEFE